MRKYAGIALAVDEVVVDSQTLVRIHVNAVSLSDWCLCLQLLQDKLVEAVIFRCADSSKKMQLICGEQGSCSVTSDTRALEVTLTSRDLDFARHFFLRYYRDGAAEVDHVDIETEEGGYITFTADEFVPPVSAEEAKRRLGM